MNKELPIFFKKEDVPIKKLFDDVSQLIQQGQVYAAREVNSAMMLLYWSIGKRINDEILFEKRAIYGEQMIDVLSEKLSAQFGRGYNRSSLFRMVIFARNYSDSQIVATIIVVSYCLLLLGSKQYIDTICHKKNF